MLFKVSDGAEANSSASKREPKTGKVTARLTESERVKLPEKVEREGYENPTNMPPPCPLAAYRISSAACFRTACSKAGTALPRLG